MTKKMTDTEMIDILELLNKENTYTGKCILRRSTNFRGWRLHETEMPGAFNSVREAIQNFANNEDERINND